jgi:hypothetical protein
MDRRKRTRLELNLMEFFGESFPDAFRAWLKDSGRHGFARF